MRKLKLREVGKRSQEGNQACQTPAQDLTTTGYCPPPHLPPRPFHSPKPGLTSLGLLKKRTRERLRQTKATALEAFEDDGQVSGLFELRLQPT